MCSNFIQLLRPDPLVADRSFLFWQLWYWHITGQTVPLQTSSTNIRNLKTQDYLAKEVLLPPLDEQRRIVAVIEEQFSRLAAADAYLTRSDSRIRAMRRAVLQNVLPTRDSQVATLADVCARIVDCEHSTAKFEAEGVACVDTTNIEPGRIVLSRLRFVSEETYAQRVRRMEPKPGDVIFAREGTVGTAVAIPEGLRLCLGQRVMVFRPSDKILPRFLELALNSPVTRAQYQRKILGTTAPHLNVADIRELVVPVPPVATQHEVVERADAQLSIVDAMESGIRAVHKRSASLRSSILYTAFSGRTARIGSSSARKEMAV